MGAMVYDCDAEIEAVVIKLKQNGASINEISLSLAYWFQKVSRYDFKDASVTQEEN